MLRQWTRARLWTIAICIFTIWGDPVNFDYVLYNQSLYLARQENTLGCVEFSGGCVDMTLNFVSGPDSSHRTLTELHLHRISFVKSAYVSPSPSSFREGCVDIFMCRQSFKQHHRDALHFICQ